jgi:gamma-glutamylcyclotransferase (GGCT)/AIG2-like uncharacterized protein YtfP
LGATGVSVTRHRLFVYGSLKRGHVHHARLSGARWLGEARTEAGHGLVVYGAYPALVSGGDGVVQGELWEVGDALLAELDVFEDVPRLYVRRSVRLDDGSEAESYFAARDGEFAPVPGGVWQEG